MRTPLDTIDRARRPRTLTAYGQGFLKSLITDQVHRMIWRQNEPKKQRPPRTLAAAPRRHARLANASAAPSRGRGNCGAPRSGWGAGRDLKGLEAADDGADDRLAVSHLLDPHLFEGLHQLLLAVRPPNNLLKQRH